MEREEIWERWKKVRQLVEAHYFLWGDDKELAQLEILESELNDLVYAYLGRLAELRGV